MKRSVTLVLALFLLSACQKYEESKALVDEWSFTLTGGTLFSEPFQVTTKQLHFDTGELFGKDLVFEGKIEETGEDTTHLVMADTEGRILIVLTPVEDAYKILQKNPGPNLRVLGRLERGKKGLPYILAKAVKSGVESTQVH